MAALASTRKCGFFRSAIKTKVVLVRLLHDGHLLFLHFAHYYIIRAPLNGRDVIELAARSASLHGRQIIWLVVLVLRELHHVVTGGLIQLLEYFKFAHDMLHPLLGLGDRLLVLVTLGLGLLYLLLLQCLLPQDFFILLLNQLGIALKFLDILIFIDLRGVSGRAGVN